MAKTHANRGKTFEAELKETLAELEAYCHNFDNVGAGTRTVRRPCDKMACYHGWTVFAEAKETRVPRIDFGRVQPHQLKHLVALNNANGIPLVCVLWRFSGGTRRAFAIPITWWLYWGGDLDRASLPLTDKERPSEGVWELERLRLRLDGPLIWDLRPCLRDMVEARLPRLQEVLFQP